MTNREQGIILKGVGGLYTVKITDERSERRGERVQCRARGAFRHNNITPLAGDRVLLHTDDENKKDHKAADSGLVIDEILERKNALIRPPLANLDYIFVTMAAAHPTPILATVDKLISIAEFNRIEPVIIVTKCDLDEAEAQRILDIYRRSGFTAFAVSSVTGVGVEDVKAFVDTELCGKIAAFAGASGIGKSTLMNALFPNLELSTSDISRKIERGRHTTRHVELFEISEQENTGYLADTPGFSMLDFQRFDFFECDDLVHTMRDFSDYIGKCKYTKCSHTKEEGCAVLDAVKRGEICKCRHESFLEIYEVLKQKKKW